MRRRFTSAVLAALFIASGALPLIAAAVVQVNACCARSAHSCCRRHSAGQTTVGVVPAPDCPSGCRLSPGVVSGASLFVPQGRAAFQHPTRVDEQIFRSQPRFTSFLSLSPRYQRPPPRSL